MSYGNYTSGNTFSSYGETDLSPYALLSRMKAVQDDVVIRVSKYEIIEAINNSPELSDGKKLDPKLLDLNAFVMFDTISQNIDSPFIHGRNLMGNTVLGDALVTQTIRTEHLALDSIVTDRIVDGAVTLDKLSPGLLDSTSKVADNLQIGDIEGLVPKVITFDPLTYITVSNGITAIITPTLDLSSVGTINWGTHICQCPNCTPPEEVVE